MSEEKKEEQPPQTQERRGGPRRGGKGFGRGGRGGRRGNRDEEEWKPLTNLGRLVKMGKIKKLEEIYYQSVPIKEYQIVDYLYEKGEHKNNQLREECMKVKSVQKQTKAGQRTRFKCVIACGDGNGHLGVGTKVAKEVQIAMKGASQAAKLSIIPVRRGYWGNKIGNPHTVPTKVTGKCGSVRMRFIPAARGTGVVGSPPTKKMMQFAGIHDVFSQSTGSTDTRENFVRAVYDAMFKTYCYLTPELWLNRPLAENLYMKYHADIKRYTEKKDYEQY